MDYDNATTLSRLLEVKENLNSTICFSQDDTLISPITLTPKSTISTTATTMELAIRNSLYPNTFENLGPYEKLSDVLQAEFNTDPCLHPNFLMQIPPLFVNAIIYTSHFCILLLSVEAYGRSAELDAHVEKSRKSIPLQHLTISIVGDQADGRTGMQKLVIIGCKYFNILCTASLVVSPENHSIANVGHSVDSYTVSLDYIQAHVSLMQTA